MCTHSRLTWLLIAFLNGNFGRWLVFFFALPISFVKIYALLCRKLRVFPRRLNRPDKNEIE